VIPFIENAQKGTLWKGSNIIYNLSLDSTSKLWTNQSRLQVKDHIQEPTRARRLTEPIQQNSDWQDNNKGQAKGQATLIV
jgi:hypothetical protein